MSIFRQALKQSFIYSYYRRFFRDKLDARLGIREWELQGRPLPPPARYKQQLIGYYAKKYKARILVETGTFQGDTIAATRRYFDTIYSIEIEPTLYQKAKRRFAADNNIQIINGDSAEKLPQIIEKLDGPAVFWLDAHYSAGNTGKGKLDSPLIEELELIQRNMRFDHVLLLDDARDFWGTNGYPNIAEVIHSVYKSMPGYSLSLINGIIHISKQRGRIKINES